LTLPKAELETLLSELKLYRTLRKKLGDRGKRVFEAGRSGEKTLKIEYFPDFSKADVEKTVAAAFGKNYSEGYRVEWKENSALKGGIRVFFGDEMADLSYSHVERILATPLI
jgi:hypothetical protein